MSDAPVQLDYERPSKLMSPQIVLLTCVPGIAALVMYSFMLALTMPPIVAFVIGYLFWPVLFLSVPLGIWSILRFRRQFPKDARPWYVSVSIAGHFLALLMGIPFTALFLVAALTGHLK